MRDWYESNFEYIVNSGIIGRVSNNIHFLMEKGAPPISDKIIEVGAGQGFHSAFVKSTYSLYLLTDKRKSSLDKIILGEKMKSRVVNAENLSKFYDSSFDRLIATCLLAHLEKPEKALKEWKRIIKKNGHLTIYVPCEPGLILRLTRFFTTALKAKRNLKVNYFSIHYREHINFYIRMNLLIEETFSDCKIRKVFYPFRFNSWNSNLGVIYQIKKCS